MYHGAGIPLPHTLQLIMENYIRLYDNVLSDEYCDLLRDKFDSDPDSHDHHHHGPMRFSQININKNWNKHVQPITDIMSKQILQYKTDVGVIDRQWPDHYAWEEFRLKRYLPNGKDEFASHVDAVDRRSSIRFLAFFIYLDDNEEGGTHFPQMGATSPCKKGSMLLFPPFWTYLHAGLKPIEKPKYILGSYLHFLSLHNELMLAGKPILD